MPGPCGPAPVEGGAVALAECGKVFLASDGGVEELTPALVDIHQGSQVLGGLTSSAA